MDLTLLLRSIPQAVIATDRAGAVTYWSRSAESLYGWRADEVLGRHIADVTVPTPAFDRARDIMAELEHGRDWSGAFRVRRKNGSQFIALVTNAPIIDESGETIGIIGVSTPLDRFDTPQLVAESDTFYRDIVESAQEGILMADPESRIVYVNDRFASMLGWQAGDLIGQPLSLFLPTEEQARFEEIRSRRRDGISEQYELRMRRADDTVLWTLVEASPLFDRNGEYRGSRGSIIDITARKRSEEQLQQREAQLREAQKVARIASWEVDLHGGVARVEDSAATARVLRGMPPELPLDDALDLIHPADRERVSAALRETETTGRPLDVEYRYRISADTYDVVHARGELVRAADGRALRIAGVVQNITDRKRLEERLQQAERISSIGRLAASLAHEFNNILMGIQPFAELITRRAVRDDVANAAAQIAGSVHRGKRITRDILRFTRTPDPVLRTIDVMAWLKAVEPELRQLVSPRARLHISATPGLRMYGDDEQLLQVLSNLSLNAADAMPGGGDLYINATADGGFVHFAVRDTGSGMTADTLQMIFQPLFTTKKVGGTGLGLAIAYQVVQRHGGEIVAESELGKGSTFHLRIPMSQEDAVLVPPRMTSLGATKWPFARITLVEDNEAVAAGLAAMLELDGVSVDVAATGAEAVGSIENHRSDAVVLDVGLPDISGISVYGEIAKRWPALPILFSTGHGDERLLAEVLVRPNVAYLQKPYDIETLLDELRKLRIASEE